MHAKFKNVVTANMFSRQRNIEVQNSWWSEVYIFDEWLPYRNYAHAAVSCAHKEIDGNYRVVFKGRLWVTRLFEGSLESMVLFFVTSEASVVRLTENATRVNICILAFSLVFHDLCICNPRKAWPRLPSECKWTSDTYDSVT